MRPEPCGPLGSPRPRVKNVKSPDVVIGVSSEGREIKTLVIKPLDRFTDQFPCPCSIGDIGIVIIRLIMEGRIKSGYMIGIGKFTAGNTVIIVPDGTIIAVSGVTNLIEEIGDIRLTNAAGRIREIDQNRQTLNISCGGSGVHHRVGIYGVSKGGGILIEQSQVLGRFFCNKYAIKLYQFLGLYKIKSQVGIGIT